MRRTVLSLVFLLAVLGATSLAVPRPENATREEGLKRNQELLARWRQEPEHLARLLRDQERFDALPPDEQEQLRKLDRELHQRDASIQSRLWSVLERYQSWLERLPEEERRKINAAQGEERLRLIRQRREQEWIDQLPPATRNALLSMPKANQPAEIARLKEEQRVRAQEAAKNVATARPPRRDPKMRIEALPDDLKKVVKQTLLPKLNRQERERLDKAENKYPNFPRLLMDLSRKHKVPLPGLDTMPGPKEFWEGLRS